MFCIPIKIISIFRNLDVRVGGRITYPGWPNGFNSILGICLYTLISAVSLQYCRVLLLGRRRWGSAEWIPETHFIRLHSEEVSFYCYTRSFLDQYPLQILQLISSFIIIKNYKDTEPKKIGPDTSLPCKDLTSPFPAEHCCYHLLGEHCCYSLPALHCCWYSPRCSEASCCTASASSSMQASRRPQSQSPWKRRMHFKLW